MQVGWAPHLGMKALLSFLSNHQTIPAICGASGSQEREGKRVLPVKRDGPVPRRGEGAMCAVICTKGQNSPETGSGGDIKYCGDQGTCFPDEVSGSCLKTIATAKTSLVVSLLVLSKSQMILPSTGETEFPKTLCLSVPSFKMTSSNSCFLSFLWCLTSVFQQDCPFPTKWPSPTIAELIGTRYAMTVLEGQSFLQGGSDGVCSRAKVCFILSSCCSCFFRSWLASWPSVLNC